MDIFDKRSREMLVRLDSLASGAVFEHNDIIHILTDRSEKVTLYTDDTSEEFLRNYEVVDLASGTVGMIPGDALVIKLRALLEVENE